MIDSDALTAFGLLFEEAGEDIKNLPMILYDEEEDISVTFDQNGNKYPVVEADNALALSTHTATKMATEGNDPDDDAPMARLSTRTETYIYQESSDADPDSYSDSTYLLSTKTMTASIESLDDDDE